MMKLIRHSMYPLFIASGVEIRENNLIGLFAKKNVRHHGWRTKKIFAFQCSKMALIASIYCLCLENYTINQITALFQLKQVTKTNMNN